MALATTVLLASAPARAAERPLMPDGSETPTVVATPTPAPPAAADYLAHALDLIEQHALHSDRVDWPAVRRRTAPLSRAAREPADTHGAIRDVLRRLGDGHSFLMPPRQAQQWSSGAARNPTPEVRPCFGDVGCLAVPAYSGNDAAAIRRYALELQAAIAARAATARCGFVVDLRGNGGGNMWPMLGGLAPLLGEGTLGFFIDRGGRRVEWSWGDSKLHEGSTVWLDLGEEHGALAAPPPVAVLTSALTASSGEAVAIAFRQRPRARSFGQPTRGLSTANEVFPLADGANLVLTVAVMADRTAQTYGGRIVPDVVVRELATVDATMGGRRRDPGLPDSDAALAAAVRWLRSESDCRAAPRGERGKRRP